MCQPLRLSSLLPPTPNALCVCVWGVSWESRRPAAPSMLLYGVALELGMYSSVLEGSQMYFRSPEVYVGLSAWASLLQGKLGWARRIAPPSRKKGQLAGDGCLSCCKHRAGPVQVASPSTASLQGCESPSQSTDVRDAGETGPTGDVWRGAAEPGHALFCGLPQPQESICKKLSLNSRAPNLYIFARKSFTSGSCFDSKLKGI